MTNLIYLCCALGTAKMLKLILKCSTEGINQKCGGPGETPLFGALSSCVDPVEKIRILLEAGADPSITSSIGEASILVSIVSSF